MKIRDLLQLDVLAVILLKSRNDRYKVLRQQGRMLLPKMHCADVDWPHHLLEQGYMQDRDVNNPDHVTAGTVEFINATIGVEILRKS